MTPPEPRTSSRALGPILAWAFAIAVAIVGAWVVLFVRRGEPEAIDVLWSPALAVGFTTVGALIVDRRPGHVIGRLCLAIGLVLGIQLALVAAVAIVDVRPGRLPTELFVLARVAEILQPVGMLAIAPLVARFPDGRLPSDRWRVIDLLVIGSITVQALALFRPGEVGRDWILPGWNPIGIEAIPIEVWDAAGSGSAGLAVLALVLATIALALTYRRSPAGVRAQVRWVLSAVAAAVGGVLLLVLANWSSPLAGVAFGLVLLAPMLVPVGIGVAILRYRLYEIDRIVSRTIGYAAVTAVLALTFLGANLVLQAVLGSIVRADTLAVAASTLVVAALFAPLRSRVQRVVDLRFHRARHDAERTAADFADRLRDEVDLAALRGATLSAVDRAVEPAASALWLRGRTPAG